MTVRVGLVGPKKSANGYGIGHYIAREVLNSPVATLIAIMGVTRESIRHAVDLINSGKNTARTFSGAMYTIERKEDFFRRNDIDLVIICSPSETHEEYICEALQNNKHVLVEKPLIKTTKGISLSARIQMARNLLDIAREKSLFLSTNCQRAAVIPVLVEQFGITDTPSTVQIEFTVGIKSKILENPEDLFDLLIAHPLSLLAKFGVSDHESIQVQGHLVQRDYRTIRYQLKGYCKAYKKDMMYVIILQQSMKQSLAAMRVTVDNIGPVDITMKLSNEGEIITQYTTHNTSSAPLFTEDTLKISIRRIINALNYTEESRCPLISNEESFTIYAMQEIMREAIFGNIEGRY